jgi:hypothetical protein
MTKTIADSELQKSMTLLSRMLLMPSDGDKKFDTKRDELNSKVRNMSLREFEALVGLADANHVLVRGLEAILQILHTQEADIRTQWAETALAAEQARIRTALPFLSDVCAAFADQAYEVTVIKTLDHWPDFGSDMDLYTGASPEDVLRLMRTRFDAQLAPRSWGDRLANKWNFMIPGLPEAVEIHMGRLGQTGEHVAMASHLAKRSRSVVIEDYVFRVPAASDRLMISTLQRMYRHFYFRLCDIVDSAALVETGAIDYEDLRSSAIAADIWEGVATYLAIVSDYMSRYRGYGLSLPRMVIETARFGGDEIYYGKSYLRVPIMPQSAKLYVSQLAGLLRKRELQSGARLSLLPWLATAALVGQKITGSDKGIW